MLHSWNDVELHYSHTFPQNTAISKRLKSDVMFLNTVYTRALKHSPGIHFNKEKEKQAYGQTGGQREREELVILPPSKQRVCAGENSEWPISATTENDTWIWLQAKGERSSGILTSFCSPSKKTFTILSTPQDQSHIPARCSWCHSRVESCRGSWCFVGYCCSNLALFAG